jgi:hypothetical protein
MEIFVGMVYIPGGGNLRPGDLAKEDTYVE